MIVVDVFLENREVSRCPQPCLGNNGCEESATTTIQQQDRLYVIACFHRQVSQNLALSSIIDTIKLCCRASFHHSLVMYPSQGANMPSKSSYDVLSSDLLLLGITTTYSNLPHGCDSAMLYFSPQSIYEVKYSVAALSDGQTLKRWWK